MTARYLYFLTCFWLLPFVLGQSFTGTYSVPTETGTITLSLTQDGAKVTGIIEGDGTRFTLDGEVDPDDANVSYGLAQTPESTLGFQAYLEAGKLYFYLVNVNEQGEIDFDNAAELVFDPVAASASSPEVPSNPLAAPPAGNPLAPTQAADMFAGTYVGDGLKLSLKLADDQYSGQLELSGQAYPVVALATSGNGLTGGFQVGEATYTFSATLQGDLLELVSDGATYRLSKETGNPLTRSADPSGSGPSNPPTAPTNVESPILAEGQFARLSQDDALAFVEALEFSLAQLGYAYTFTEAERQQIYQEMVRTFPAASQQDQLVLSQARDILTRVSANWSVANDADKKEFILGVMILAFGEGAVQQWVGQGTGQDQALGSGGGCASFDDCAGKYLDGDTWTDTANAQGCWAAAGCSGYDGATDTFTYDDYSYSD